MANTVNTFPSNDVKNLEVKAAAAKVVFYTAADGEIRVETENLEDSAYRCELRDNKLLISYMFHMNRVISLPGYHEAQIRLFLPESLVLENVSCNIGAGEMNMEKIPFSCRDMDVEIGAGKWKTENLCVSRNLHIEVGAGKIKLKQANSGSLKLDCGAGECFYNGQIDGGFQVNCGVGNCQFQLANNEQDFDYDISCALGEVNVNGRKIRTCGFEKRRFHENSAGKAVLQCGLGKITLRTA